MWTAHDTLPALLLLLNLLLLGSSRLLQVIRLSAWQGALIGLLPLLSPGGQRPAAWALAAVIIGLKGLVFPGLLRRAVRESGARREVEPYVGYLASVLIGLGFIAVSFRIAAALPPAPDGVSSLLMPLALSATLTGLFITISRRKAVSQVLGYLVMENGIYAFGLALVPELPLLIELGTLMDVFVGVFVMGIAMYHINREFDHLDADALRALKG